MSARQDRAASIFDAAVELATPGERAAYLDAACGRDAQLRAEVEDLLAHDGAAGSFLDLPAGRARPAAAGSPPVREGPGTVIGPYRLLEQIGEGGMGLVFVAEQQRPVRRQVALKVIKPGMDTRQVIARFEAEQQALALMDHPNIAKVLDGGETASGRPYFVMELVKGQPITDYCDANRAPVRERLELFVQVCQAVQHAHQRGIIHRDLKPSNVLVVSNEGTPLVQVIDFGVAKAVGQQLTDKTIHTLFPQFLGTPLYMSPEQAGENGRDVDTRTDIYALGVLLYELLTGTTPFAKERLKTADFVEIRRIICEEEPPRPSTRLSEQSRSVFPRRTPPRGGPDVPAGPTALAATTVSEKRPGDPRKLSRLFRGELDWIVMKALEKDRNRRYESAGAFAADVVRYLNHEVVQACPPSARYRLGKFVRRYRVPFAVATLAVVTLLLAAIGLAVSNVLIERERREATRQRDDARVQRHLARRAVDKMYTQVAERWLSQQPQLEPLQREFLEDALHFYQDFSGDRSADPELRLETGNAYRRVGEIQEKLGELFRAEEALTRAIASLEQLAADFPQEPRYRAVLASSHHRLGSLFRRREQLEEAEKELQRSLFLHKALVAERPGVAEYELELAYSYSGLANVWLGEGRGREAVGGYRQALSLLQKLPPDLASRAVCRRHQANCTLDIGQALAASGRHREAEAFCRQAVLLHEKVVQDFPRDAGARHDLAWALWCLSCRLPERFSPEAESLLRRALVLESQLMGDYPRVPDYRRVATTCQASLAGWLHEHGRFREADEAFSQAFGRYEKLVAEAPCLPGDGFGLLEVLVVLRPLLLQSGRYDEAEKTIRKVLALAERLAAEFPRTPRFSHLAALSHDTLGVVLGEVGRPEEAEKAFHEASAIWSELVKKHPAHEEYRHWLAWSHNDLADLLATGPAAQYRDAPRAVRLAQKAVELYPQYGGFWNTLGTAHYRAGDYRAAVRELEKAMALNGGGDCYDWFFLAMAHRRLGHEAEARQFYDRAVAWMAANQQRLEKSKLEAARFRRFRAEAAALLRIEDASTTTGKEVSPKKK
jgi:serine/threonine protein kinase/tetratricopeptide (TPR) repeat protein